MLISYGILLISVMIAVGYFVLLERKILSSIHLREGPKKTGLIGLVQPLCDGGKLFSKKLNTPMTADYLIFLMSPILGLLLCFSLWFIYISKFDTTDLLLSFLIFLCLSSVNAYVMILSGWSSNSIYSSIGSYRGVAQTISYEITSALLMIGIIVSVGNFNFKWFTHEKALIMMCFLSMLVWLSVMLAESNRSPYDFVEGESELVSGFNVEYSSIMFSMLFLSEYGMMMFMSYLGSILFFSNSENIYPMSLFMLGFIWIRGVLPRFRYDKLMSMAWKSYLFYSLSFLIFTMGIINMMAKSWKFET